MKEKDNNKSIWSKRALVVLIAFGIVAFWRGCWSLMDTYLIPQDEILSYISSIVIGVLMLLFSHKIITYLRQIKKFLKIKKTTKLDLVVFLYLFLYSIIKG